NAAALGHDRVDGPVGSPTVHAAIRHVTEIEIPNAVDARPLDQSVSVGERLEPHCGSIRHFSAVVDRRIPGTPARARLRTAERRMSWKRRLSTPERGARAPPRLPKVADRTALAMEDERTVQAARGGCGRDDVQEIAHQGEHARPAVLRPRAAEPDRATHDGI